MIPIETAKILIAPIIEEFLDDIGHEIRAAFQLEIQWLADKGCELLDETGTHKVTVNEFLDGKIQTIKNRINGVE